MGEPGRDQDEDIEVHVDQSNLQTDLSLVQIKLHEIADVLKDFKNKRDPTMSRKDYISDLKGCVKSYYDYNEDLAGYLIEFFSPNELIEFLEANEQPRPMTIRTNTLKTRRRELSQNLMQRGVGIDVLGDWTKVALKITSSKVPIGATPEYLGGHYIIQSASSLLPVMALAPRPGERVLDMSAAPGGKTSHIAQLMKNTGNLFANDISKDRLSAVKGNLFRMGVTNAVITNYDGRKYQKLMSGFDRVLLDAPCSGLGVIYKDFSVKRNRTLRDIKQNAHLQKELLLSAIDCTNARSGTGGYIVYSTCSISIEENEEVIEYALKNRHVKIVETGIEIAEPGLTKYQGKHFSADMSKCARTYPHVHNMDGFFVCKLKKLENALPENASKPHSAAKRPKIKKIKLPETEGESPVEESEEYKTKD